jgi:hypothetical protein
MKTQNRNPQVLLIFVNSSADLYIQSVFSAHWEYISSADIAYYYSRNIFLKKKLGLRQALQKGS